MMKAILTSLSALLLLIAFGSCRKYGTDNGTAESGLTANTTYHCDTVNYIGSPRVFTSAGELTDRSKVDQYLAAHSYLFGNPSPAGMHPSNIYSTSSRMVYFDVSAVYKATLLQDSALTLEQQDTSKVTHTSDAAGTDIIYQNELRFQSVRNALLDMQNSYTAVTRLSPESYRTAEALMLKAKYTAGSITLPYNFLAMGAVMKSYPLPLRSVPAPNVQPGDTLVLQQGSITFRQP